MCAVEAISVNDHELGSLHPLLSANVLQFYISCDDYRLLAWKSKSHR
jgi:hypothetical protein